MKKKHLLTKKKVLHVLRPTWRRHPPSEAAGFPTVAHGVVPEGNIVARDIESSKLFQNNQRENEVFMYC